MRLQLKFESTTLQLPSEAAEGPALNRVKYLNISDRIELLFGLKISCCIL